MEYLIKTTSIILAVIVLSLTGLAEEKTQAAPNVLFILVDDMGWRDLACYGHEIHESPNIDGLASRGMRFTNAYAACPICAPSRAAIMTGKFPSNSGFVDNYASELNGKVLQRAKERQSLKLKEVTLAEAFKAGGYQTGFVGKWHLSGTNESRLPTDQGFDVNVAGGWWGHPRGRTGYFSPYDMFALENGPKGEYLTDRLTSEAIQVMDDFSKRDKPWLLYMSYYTVHGPFHSKKEKTKKYAAKASQRKVTLKSAAYAGMVESLDENVGRMLDWLGEKKLRKNTIVIFTSDNGGMIRATHNRPLRSYKGDLYEGGIRVPCIVDWPGGIKPGSVSDTPVHGVDFYATLLAMTGLSQQTENHEDSVNLVPLFKGDTDFKRAPLVWHVPVGVPHIAHSKPGSVIRSGDWKFLRFYEDGREELYNLKDDIGETKNVATSMPKKAAELKAQLNAVLRAHNAAIPIDVPAKPTPRPRKKKARPNPRGTGGSGGAGKAPIQFELTPELFGSDSYRPGPFVVHLHCGDGKATGKLLTRKNAVVQGLDTDPKNLAAAKSRPEYRKSYGSRLTFRSFVGKHLPYINNTVNVIVSSKELAVSPQEIHRVLAPGGMAIFRSATKPTVNESLASVTTIDTGRYRGLYRLEKKWPTDIDEWTHHMHGPDNNRVAKDTRLAPPLSHLQWSAAPRYTRHHEYMSSFQAMVSARGRIFYIIDEGKHDSILLPPDWNLVARDAFNGIILWKRPLKNWFNHLWPFKSGPLTLPRRLVVKDDVLFVTMGMGEGVTALDASSGELLYTMKDTEDTEEIIIDGDRMFLVKRQWLSEATKHEVKERIKSGASTGRVTSRFNSASAKRQSVMAIDLTTRKLLWQQETPVAPHGIGSRDGRVYVFDGQTVVSRKADGGAEIWRSAKLLGERKSYAVNYGCNLVCDAEKILVGSAVGEHMLALSVKDGKELWRKPQYRSGRHSPRDLLLIDNKAWTTNTLAANMLVPGISRSGNKKSSRVTGYDLKDGAVASDFFPDNDVYSMNARCHMSCATENFLITSRTGTELVSLTDEKWHIHHWVRGACLYGLMPANGIIYAPPNPCACYTQSKLNGFNAVTGFDKQWASTVKAHQGQTFVPGSAEAKPVRGPNEPQAWPVYRHDNSRSGATPSKVKLPLQTGWRTTGYENLTGMVVAGGLCVFAEKDRHTVHALDAKTGAKKWSFIAGGRIDSPPTIAGAGLFFGCADGWLYHLRTADGELVWKRRIATADLSLFVRGQPESVWPMSGSVLVQDGKVYCVSGRSAFLDGGLRLAVVDASSGDVLFDNRMDNLDPSNAKNMHQHIALQNMPVALPDLLSSDGKHLYMLTQQFDLKGKRTHIKNAAFEEGVKMGIDREHIFSATGFLDENSFHRTYWVYGNSFLEGCSMPDAGWFEMGRISPSGKMLCFDDKAVYGYGQFPEYAKWSGPLRYSLFAVKKVPKSYTPGKSDKELSKTRLDWRKWRSARLPKVEFDFQWRLRPPVRAKAIVKTADMLFVAGPEDLIDEESVYGNTKSALNRSLLKKQNDALLSPKGGKLMAVSVANGGVVQKMDLESGPVWDGMAAAYGKLFMCCKDGSVVALANDGTNKADGIYSPDALKQPKATLSVEKVATPSPAPKTKKPKALTKPKSNVKPKSRSQVTLTRIGGKIASVSSFESHRRPEHMIDGDPSTFWHTRFRGGDAKPPHFVVLEVPTGTRVAGLTYTAWVGGNGNGHVKAYSVSVSDDGKNWDTPILSGTLKTGLPGTSGGREQIIKFPLPNNKTFIRFEITASQSNGKRFLAAIGELDVVIAEH